MPSSYKPLSEGQTPASQPRSLDETRLIRDYLRCQPWASAEEICRSLQSCGLMISIEVVGALLVAIKTG